MAKRIADLTRETRVVPGTQPLLKSKHASHTFGWQEEAAKAETARIGKLLAALQYKLYADGRFAVLVVLQAIDGGGKDSTTRHVFSSFNPQGCTVHSFKVPSAEELRHDYLWRVHQKVPPRGEIGVFNRSHYEDVLVVRVDSLVPKQQWQRRYQQINDFEEMLTREGTLIVKFFLQISKDEQRRRFEDRIRDPVKRWKFDAADLGKREQWGEYRNAFEEMLANCSTTHAPWHVIPANHEWLRDLAVSQVMLQALQSLPLEYPKPGFDPNRIRVPK
ncbi:MAG TPA: polyphosphate kinase 2 family protein [Steroidobacteraceae bacterium]|nr:polyphosphate kinase 2 family protein [Steroidobacteraceae bacterium]